MMIAITPYSQPDQLGDYQSKIVDLYMADAALNQAVPDSIRESTEWLLRMVNCFYSNKIEGNPTHPKELLRAQDADSHGDDSAPPEAIMEHLAHIETQIKFGGAEVAFDQACTEEFIKGLHKSFYERCGDNLRKVKNRDGSDALDKEGKPLLVVPGEYRQHLVTVGRHEPLDSSEIKGYMDWLQRVYNPQNIHGTTRVIAAAGLHHRLAWIHPFIDGNGRVIRLLTDCYMRNAGFGGYGLWSITRGFGRDTKAYYSALARADTPRQGSTDGRGKLSDAGLLEFTKYFIDTALDQVRFFSDLLEPKKLNIRIDYYFEMRAKGGLPDEDGRPLPLLKIVARDIYKLLLDKGPMKRADIVAHLDKGEQTLRPVFQQMERENLIHAKPKRDIELKISAPAIEFLFPNVF